MKFRVNTEVFLKAVKAAAVIATKNIKKCGDRNEPFHLANLVSLEASSKALCLKAYGGMASITYTITETEGYTFDKSGGITVLAKELQSALRSFPLEEQLYVSIDNDQLRIAPTSEKDNFISVPIIGQVAIQCPNTSKQNDQVTIVDREHFVKCLQKIKFAPAVKETMLCYMCVLFESWKNSFKFSSGTGGRFIVDQSEGKSISTDKTKLIFPSNSLASIIDVLKHSDDKTIKIRSVAVDAINRIPEQIVMETNSVSLAIYGLEHFTKYPDMNKVFNYEYPYSVSTRAKDWKYAIEAIAASRHFNKNSIHNTKITADLLHGYFELETNTALKMNKKIPFESGVFVTDPNKDKSYKPWFQCNSDYLQEMVKIASKDDVVVINFKDQSGIETLDGKQAQKYMKPVLIHFPEKNHKDGVIEKFFMFFSISTKW